MGTLFNDGRDETGKLWFLPALFIGQLHVYKIEALERMVLLDTPEEVHTAVLAGIALNGSFFVHNRKLRGIRCHRDGVSGYNTNNGEERTGWLPTFGAPTGVVVGNIASQSDLDLVGGAAAVELPTGEVTRAWCDAIVDERVQRGCHSIRVCKMNGYNRGLLNSLEQMSTTIYI